MDNRNVIVAAILGLLLIEILTLYYKKEPIELALHEQTLQAISAAKAAVGEVEFDGRDATLRGEVHSEEEKSRLVQIVQEVKGVRIVTDKLVIKEEDNNSGTNYRPVTPILTYSFRLSQGRGDTLRIHGKVPDHRSHNQIIVVVKDAYPDKVIADQLIIESSESGDWLASLINMISAISVVQNPEVEIDLAGKIISLKGSVGAEVQKVDVLRDVGLAIDTSMILNDTLTVVADTKDPQLVALEKRILDLTTSTRIQFKINTANLADLSKAVLDQVALILKEAPTAQIEVQGHTDNLGKAELNLELSQLRANAVRAYLITKGIQASRLTAVGYGPARPVATNTTRQGRIRNRRVVFSLKGGS